MSTQEQKFGLENWLLHGTRPVCHYTALGHVTYWSGMAESCIGTETYAGLRWLHGPGYTTHVLLFSGNSSSLFPAETYTSPYRLYGSNYTTRVLLFLHWLSGFHLAKSYTGLWLCLHDPCTLY